MIVFGVSDQYLGALNKETRSYRFDFQGYGNFDSAYKGLLTVNMVEVYGFVILSNSLPREKKDLDSFRKFISTIDMISTPIGSSSKKRLVFGLLDSKGLEEILSPLKIKNLDVYLSKFESLTDIFIKRDLFGTLLDAHLSPYVASNGKKDVTGVKSLPSLKYVPALTPTISGIFSEVVKGESLEDTLFKDEYLRSQESSSIYAEFRTLVIMQHFESNTTLQILKVSGMINVLESVRVRLALEMLLDFIINREGRFHESGSR